MNYASKLESTIRLCRLVTARTRALLLSARGAKVGRKTAVGPRCRVERPWCVSLGERNNIEADVYLKMVDDHAVLTTGDYTFFGRGVEFDVMREVRIGSHTLIAPNCFITDHAHAILPHARIDQQGSFAEPVMIGSDVWIGAGTIILSGVSIGDGAVIGANSVVTRDIAAMSVVAGNPARLLRWRATPTVRSSDAPQ